jgi:two-component system cell cycle response regulator CpdR
LEILIAEDERDIAYAYKKVLEDRGHSILVTDNGERCLEIYNTKLQDLWLNYPSAYVQPFDVVMLDHRIPRINCLDVAKEILAVNPRQRMLIVSAYTNALGEDKRWYLEHDVEVLQKPINAKDLIDKIEDKIIYSELEKLDVDIKVIKAANFTRSRLLILLDFLKDHKK